MTVFKKKTELAKGVFWPSYLIGIAVMYLIIVMLLTWLQGKLERRLRQSDRR